MLADDQKSVDRRADGVARDERRVWFVGAEIERAELVRADDLRFCDSVCVARALVVKVKQISGAEPVELNKDKFVVSWFKPIRA